MPCDKDCQCLNMSSKQSKNPADHEVYRRKPSYLLEVNWDRLAYNLPAKKRAVCQLVFS